MVEESTVSNEDEEDAAVQSQVSDMSPLPSERPETPTTFEPDVPIFRDVEVDVDEASDVVCNVGLDIGDIVVEHGEIEEEEGRIARFLVGGAHASCMMAHYAALSSQHRCSRRFVMSVDSSVESNLTWWSWASFARFVSEIH